MFQYTNLISVVMGFDVLLQKFHDRFVDATPVYDLTGMLAIYNGGGESNSTTYIQDINILEV